MGNIASGKTDIAQALAIELKENYHGIDTYRKRFGTGTNSGEWRAQNLYLANLETYSGVYECLGRGSLSYQIFKSLQETQEETLIVFVNTPAETWLKTLRKSW